MHLFFYNVYSECIYSFPVVSTFAGTASIPAVADMSEIAYVSF
jgi:hypothetical protein